MTPFVGCVIKYVSSRPIESAYFDREWIIWSKKGNTVWLVENLKDVQGPPDMAFGYLHECKFVSLDVTYSRFYPGIFDE